MKTLDVVQGTPPWKAARVLHDCASDAPAVMGESKYVTRNELIKARATGIEPEISDDLQRLFNRGHAAEAAIRPYAESIVKDDLYPTVGAEGQLLASFDGITMDEATIFEHKLWSESAAAMVRSGTLEPSYYWQVEHQLLVSGAKRCLFMVSDGTQNNCVHLWYTPVAGRAEALRKGWAQFHLDVQAYTPSAPAQVVLAEAQEGLPAVAVRLDGALAVTSNLDLFGERLKAFIGGLKKKPDTDQEFANCEAAVKSLKKAEDALEAAEASALAQIDPVEAMRRTVANYRETARTTRLLLEKVVKSRKDEIRGEIQQAAGQAWTQHVATINARLKRVRITVTAPDFAGAMKGKKTIDSLRSAVDDLMAKAKIEASQQAENMAKNLATIDEVAKDHAFLVRDLQDLVSINPEHLAGVVRGRIAEHQAAEQKRLDAERDRIRAEEEAKARKKAEADAEADRERIRQEERAKAQQEAAKAATSQLAPTHTPEAIKPASATAGAARVAPQGAGVARTPASAPKPTRPTDAQIIEVLALHYRVHESKVIEWLLDVDLNAASDAMAESL